ncbi:YceI family protein [Caldimonas thermodepolymerans]|jgi:polyisoprenoid-binding protein YceI|uniref:Polyisoprenoid-binding protein n=1 Tax=Caldimonas thermodepolymerans TaxID=215580 RepID=A0A2S5T7H6_9BURK|nr:YceI family protein [Caldimonas thermodepolymerans]PPE70954.1 polyisoprenoid-binding protein [Caldimonas thermodepolymerans]QPC31253.1 YceI family protein [Caldimonas thermodepolymerans]RDH99785.1 polyisoprenoid-binding protein YceI [Caldimonas thermodepolymerans]
MKKLFLAFAASAVIAAPAWAQQKLVPAQSEIVFVSTQMGVPVEGHFRTFDAQVQFDPKKPETSSIAFTVDLGSAALGVPETEAELAKPEWFDTKRFPQARFQSTSIKATGPQRFDVAGKLTIKGQTRDLVVPVTLAQAGGTTTATGAFTLKRLEFKIGDGDWADTSMVANDVQVKFKLALTGVAPL